MFTVFVFFETLNEQLERGGLNRVLCMQIVCRKYRPFVKSNTHVLILMSEKNIYNSRWYETLCSKSKNIQFIVFSVNLSESKWDTGVSSVYKRLFDLYPEYISFTIITIIILRSAVRAVCRILSISRHTHQCIVIQIVE